MLLGPSECLYEFTYIAVVIRVVKEVDIIVPIIIWSLLLLM